MSTNRNVTQEDGRGGVDIKLTLSRIHNPRNYIINILLSEEAIIRIEFGCLLVSVQG